MLLQAGGKLTFGGQALSRPPPSSTLRPKDTLKEGHMSMGEIAFWGEMYIELTMFANQFWAHMPDGAHDGCFEAQMGAKLDHMAYACLARMPDDEIRQHWQQEYHVRYRQQHDLPF